jgi:hypothetical protein
MASTKFKLKKDIVIHCHSLDMDISNANITDENAAALLKEKPYQVRNFEVVPEEHKAKVKTEQPAAATTTSAKKKEEVKS